MASANVWIWRVIGIAMVFTAAWMPSVASAQACFGDGTTCGNDIQTLATSSPDQFSMLTVGSQTFVGVADYNSSAYIYLWQPSERCLGNGTTCGVARQQIAPQPDPGYGGQYVGSIDFVQTGSDILALVTDNQHIAIAGRVFKWQATQQCFGNGASCGSPLQTIPTNSCGGAPNVMRWHPFTENGVLYILGSSYLCSARVHQWQAAQQCFGDGTTCGAWRQLISSSSLNTGNAGDNGALLFRIGSELFLAYGKHTANTGSYLFVWQPAQRCFGDGTTCAAYVQNFPFAGVLGWSHFEEDGEHFLISATWSGGPGNMYVWQPAQRCFGNGTTCNTAVRSAVGGYSKYREMTVNGEPYIVGIGSGGLATFRWLTGQRCFGNETQCASNYNSYSSLYLARSSEFTGLDFGFVPIGANTYVVSGGGGGVQMLMSPPGVPVVTAMSSVQAMATTTIRAVAADAAGDTIRYGFDWDNNSTVDEWVPATGYVPSGTEVAVDHSWPTTGSKTYKVTTQDVTGIYAINWASKTITVSNPPPTVLLTASTLVYRQGDPAITLTWSSSGATYCAGVNFGTSYMSTSGSRSVTPTATTTYEVRCTGSTGTGTNSKTVTYAVNQAPAAPTVAGPTVVTSGTSYTYTFTAADPEGDSLRYGLDWDDNGTVDTLIPSSGYVTSGTMQSALRSWTGAQTFRARAQDNRGTSSAWTSYSISCAAVNICDVDGNIHNNCTGEIVQTCPYGCSGSSCTVPAPSFNADAPAGTTGHLTVRPSLLRPGDTTRLFWNLSNVSSCTVTGDNGDSWTGAASGSSGQVTSAITGRVIYTLSCAALPGGVPATITEDVAVRVTPAFKEL